MKHISHIFKSISAVTVALLLLCSLTISVLLQKEPCVRDTTKQPSKAPIEQNIHASNGIDAVIPSLDVQFFAVQINFLQPFEAVSLPFLFEISPSDFVNRYFTNLLTHIISPRAP
jgi:hypothetical protein